MLQRQRAGQPGQLGAHGLGPLGVQQRLEGVQGAAEAAGRTAQGAGRVHGPVGGRGGPPAPAPVDGSRTRRVRTARVRSVAVRARAGLPVQAQGAEELRGLGAQVVREGVTARGYRRWPGGGRGVRRIKVSLCHAGASGRL